MKKIRELLKSGLSSDQIIKKILEGEETEPDVAPPPTKTEPDEPEKSPSKKTKPNPFRKPGIEPGTEPQPKALPVKYPTHIKARMHPKIQRDIDTGNNPYSKLGLASDEFLADISSKHFADIVEAIEKYSGIDVKSVSDIAPALQIIVENIEDIESNYRDILEEIAVDLVKKHFGIEDDEIEFDAKISSRVDLGDVKLKGTDLNKLPKDIEHFDTTLEMAKRKFVNGLIQGAAINSLNMYHLVKEDLDKIDPDLLDMYGLLSALAEFGYWVVPGLEDIGGAPGESHSGGKSRIDLSGDKPKIIAVGKNFPILVQELVKGVMELLSTHGLPKDPNIRKKVLNDVDSLAGEFWDIRFGPKIWKKILSSLEGEYNPRAVSLFYTELVQLEPYEFKDLMRRLLDDKPDAIKKINDMYNKALDDLKEESFKLFDPILKRLLS